MRAAFEALAKVGYRPRVPMTADQMADAELRERLVKDKGMQVLQFWSEDHRETSINVFVSEPFGFDEEYAKALVREFGDAGTVRVVSIPTLIAMKEVAGRDEDLVDIRYLRMLMEEK